MPSHRVNPEHTANLIIAPPPGPYEGRHRRLWMEPSDAEELGLAGLLFLMAAFFAWFGIELMSAPGL